MFFRFIPVAAGNYARADFKAARQKDSESPLQWHSRLRELFLTAYPDRAAGVANDYDLKHQFAMGLIDQNARIFVLERMTNDDFTYTNCLTAAQNKIAVTAVVSQSEPKASTSGVNNMNTEANKNVRRCYCCQSTGHLKRDCPYMKAVRYCLDSQSGKGQNNGYIDKNSTRPPGHSFNGFRGQFRGRGRGRGGFRGRGRGGFGRHYGGSVNQVSANSTQNAPEAGTSAEGVIGDEEGGEFDIDPNLVGAAAAEMYKTLN